MTTHSEKLGNASTRSEYNVRSRGEQVNQLPSELDSVMVVSSTRGIKRHGLQATNTLSNDTKSSHKMRRQHLSLCLEHNPVHHQSVLAVGANVHRVFGQAVRGENYTPGKVVYTFVEGGKHPQQCQQR